MVHTRKERELGVLEKYQLSRNFIKAYGNVCFAVELNHPERTGETTQFYLSHLKQPLRKLIERHASLSLIVRNKEENSVCFEQLSCVDISQVVTVASDNIDLKTLIQEQCTVEFDFDSHATLWRLKVVPTTSTSCIISLAIHHVIGDGSSLSTFWKELLKELQMDNQMEEGFVVQVPEDLKLPLPYELSGAPELSVVSDILPALVENTLPKLLPGPLVRAFSNKNNGWGGDFPAVDGEPHATRVTSNKVEKERWEKIMKQAKSQQVSGHAILYAIYILTWATLYPDYSTETSTPLNCRPLCHPQIPSDQMGNYVGSHSCYWKQEYLCQALKEHSFWNLAKEYHRSLQNGKVKGAKQSLFLKFLPDFPESYCEYWQNKRNNTMKRGGGMELSDMGKIDCLNNEWTPTSMYFCQSAHTYSVALCMNSVCLNGELYYTLCWQKGAVDQEKMEKFNTTFNELVDMVLVYP